MRGFMTRYDWTWLTDKYKDFIWLNFEINILNKDINIKETLYTYIQNCFSHLHVPRSVLTKSGVPRVSTLQNMDIWERPISLLMSGTQRKLWMYINLKSHEFEHQICTKLLEVCVFTVHKHSSRATKWIVVCLNRVHQKNRRPGRLHI
jgi:hypothetical protein